MSGWLSRLSLRNCSTEHVQKELKALQQHLGRIIDAMANTDTGSGENVMKAKEGGIKSLTVKDFGMIFL
jgi:hypothetical protein